jgi:hypothetical protein
LTGFSVTTREPEYSDQDRALLLADWAERQEPRGAHGIKLSESTDPKFQYDWEVDLPTTDFAQEKLHKEQESYKNTYPDADVSSLLWRVKRTSTE